MRVDFRVKHDVETRRLAAELFAVSRHARYLCLHCCKFRHNASMK